MMDKRVDARGVSAAVRIMNAFQDDGHIAYQSIKDVCRAVIGRYDKSIAMAKLTEKATFMLDALDTGFIVGPLKELCNYLITSDPPQKKVPEKTAASC
jgi:hypothetical protein